MIRWRCECCGAVVDEPNIRVRWEDMNGEGAWMEWREALCPVCGDEQIYDFESEDMNDVEDEHDKD